MAAWEICLQDAAFLRVYPQDGGDKQNVNKNNVEYILRSLDISIFFDMSDMRLTFFDMSDDLTRSWPWIVRHSIMLKVTWRCFDQLAKQLVVGQTTMAYDWRHKQTDTASDLEAWNEHLRADDVEHVGVKVVGVWPLSAAGDSGMFSVPRRWETPESAQSLAML